MAIDHSLTYRESSLKNIPHKLRLGKIFSVLDKLQKTKSLGQSYIDIGCGNGYLTDRIRTKYRFAKVVGLDHNVENLKIAEERYPNIKFSFVDLNSIDPIDSSTHDLVTCFETLEHVGNLENALRNILQMRGTDTRVLITVPIEINFIGLVKFVGKTLVYRYKLDELPAKPSWSKYFGALIRGENISKFRDLREGWGTHFGFDYREVDRLLKKDNINFEAFNSFTTRFYIIGN